MDATKTSSICRATATKTTPPSATPTTSRECRFLAGYAATLLGCGATCMRLEMNVRRMAAAWGSEADLYTLPRHVVLTLNGSDGRSESCIVAVRPSPIDFTVNTRLSNLSWKVADGKVSFERAVRLYARITRPRSRRNWLLMLLVAAANASFCRLFGGDPVAMLLVAVATWAGFFLKLEMTRHHIDARVTVFCCAAVSGVLGCTDFLFAVGTTPALTVGTSILYLVPGIPFINSFSDLLNSHYVCAFSRFIDACVLTACLSGGLCLGMLLMGVSMF